jgi:hypothetical protein
VGDFLTSNRLLDGTRFPIPQWRAVVEAIHDLRAGLTEVVVRAAMGANTVTTPTGVLTLVTYPVEAVDTHGAWSSGVFTTPAGKSGLYLFNAGIVSAGGAVAPSQAYLTLTTSGGAAELLRFARLPYPTGTNGLNIFPHGTGLVRLTAGQVVELRLFQNVVASSLSVASSDPQNSLVIVRVPGTT